jgi:SAM-dependent methyltransferase
MPSSSIFQIPLIIERSVALDPKSVLDIGIGFGKYGYLLREYLDVMRYRYRKNEWVTRIDAIEAHPDYVLTLHQYIYDDIYIGNAAESIKKFPDKFYDLILVIDVLEHFEKEVGLAFLSECKRVGKTTIICTPVNFFEQGAVFNNEYEIHKSVFVKEDFDYLEPKEVINNYGGWIVIF